ncbi:MAG: hypothetical protein M9955_15765 [Rhizobiaceae bacterium]|nr:hypothetical protein [Rhizobiaceae bacterium]
MARKPIVQILTPSGADLVGRLGSNLAGVTIVDQAGGESDTMEIRVRVPMPAPAGPAKGMKYAPLVGWELGGMRPSGVYTVQTTSLGGDPDSGYEMTISCRAADFVDKLKEVDSEHFDEMTAGAIFSRIAARAGTTAIVDPELASIQIPYRLRWKEPAGEFAETLAQELGGTIKVAGGRMAVLKRGAGRAASGAPLPPIRIDFASCHRFDVSIEQRGLFAESDGGWFDFQDGIEKLEQGKGLGSASRYLPVHIFSTQPQAKLAADASGREEGRKSISGSFDVAGNLSATAEAPVICSGFGPDIDGASMVAACVTHEITFDEDGGWITTVEVEAKESSQ